MIGITDANPGPETLKVLLIVTIAVLSVLVLIVGYLLARRDAAITAATENLTTIVGQLKELVNNLTIQYQIRQPIVDERLKKHGEQLDDHSERLTHLETEHKMIHCNHTKKTRKKITE